MVLPSGSLLSSDSDRLQRMETPVSLILSVAGLDSHTGRALKLTRNRWVHTTVSMFYLP
jgi:hypothetical protein